MEQENTTNIAEDIAATEGSASEPPRKRKKRGEGLNKGPRNPINLRPCEVCGAKATGNHFGAITCEACKSFYRRSILRNVTYACSGEDPTVKCPIRQVKGSALPCPACRMAKCLELNMSIDASRKGRFTHELRSEAIKASRSYWSNKKNSSGENETTVPEVTSSTDCTKGDHDDDPKKTDVTIIDSKISDESSKTVVKKEESAIRIPPSVAAQSSPGTDVTTSGIPPNDVTMARSNALREALTTDSSCHQDGWVALNGALAEFKDTEDELDSVIEQTSNAFDAQNFTTKGFLARVPQMQHKYLTGRCETQELFGSLAPISGEEHKKILDETGIDVDGRLEFLCEFLQSLDPHIKRVIGYLKSIPGFCTLPPQDQLSILQGTKIEQLATIFFPVHNVEEGVLTTPLLKTRRTVNVNIWNELHSPGVFQEYQRIVGLIQELELTDHEYAVLSATCLMQPDACVTESGVIKCRTIQNKLRRAQKKLLSRRIESDGVDVIMNRIGIIEQCFRNLTSIHRDSWRHLFDRFKRHLTGISVLTLQYYDAESLIHT